MKQMNLVELYHYIKEHGEARIKAERYLGYTGTIYDDGNLDGYLRDNFGIFSMFEVSDESDEEPFKIIGWEEKVKDSITRDVVIFGNIVSIPIDYQTYAVDEDGSIFAYRAENPKLTDYEWLSACYIYLGNVNYKGDWKQSLTKI